VEVAGLNVHFLAPRQYPWLLVSSTVGDCRPTTETGSQSGRALLAHLKGRARGFLAPGSGPS
jgi:hypothetical protein